ncbi:condensation domain-containing protein [Azotobacter sp. CWF10]
MRCCARDSSGVPTRRRCRSCIARCLRRWKFWSGTASARREAGERLQAILRQELADGFDLSRPPLLRMRLVRLANDVFYWVQSFHHILMDAWCRSLLFTEFFQYYEAYRRGASAEPALPRPYRDFIAWLQTQDETSLRNFWQQELRGFDTVTPIPYRKQYVPAGGVALVADAFASLSRLETTALQNIARQHQLTVNTIVQGAWALLLGRLGQTDEVLFGVTVAGRPWSWRASRPRSVCSSTRFRCG